MKKIFLAVLSTLLVFPLYAARPIAAWDVVPYQRVTGVFNVGVVAFHDKKATVEFSINGKKIYTVSEPKFNARTGVKEYYLPFPSKKFSDKLKKDYSFIIGAKVLVEGEAPYTLPDLPVYTNDRGTFSAKKAYWVDAVNGNDFADGSEGNPLKTLAQAVKKVEIGGTIYLKPGTYSLMRLGGGVKRDFWTLITPAPGVSRNDIKMLPGRTGTEKLHFKGLNFYANVGDGEYGTIAIGEGGKTMAWFENCNFTNLKGRYEGECYPFGNKLVAYVTGGGTYEMSTGPTATLVRNHIVKSIASKAFACSECLVVNCTVDDVAPEDGAVSSECVYAVALMSNWEENLIYYGVKFQNVDCRAIYIQRLKNSAFVDVTIECKKSEENFSLLSDEIENVIFANLNLLDQPLKWRLSSDGRGDFKPTNVLMKDCTLGNVEGFNVFDGSKGLELRNCTYKLITE